MTSARRSPSDTGGFQNFRPILAGRKVMATAGWKMDRDDWCQILGTDYMDGKPCVVVREMSKRPAAAVVTQAYDPKLGRTATTLIDHKLLYCRVATEDEAHYLVAMINSTPMQDLLGSFLNEVGVAPVTLARLPIPPYVPAVADALVKAAKDAQTAANDGDMPKLAEAEKTADVEVRKLVAAAAKASQHVDPTGSAAAAAVAAEVSPDPVKALAAKMAADARAAAEASSGQMAFGGEADTKPDGPPADAASDSDVDQT